MKRLIALLVGLTVLLSMSLTSFAAFTDAIELNADGVTYTAALSDEAATANAGKQTTIVAYKGDTIDVGSIQYINQEAATSFTFQLMDELTEDVKVVMGGEAIDKQEVGTIFVNKPTPTPEVTPVPNFTVSGTITDPALVAAGINFDDLAADPELGEEFAAEFKAAWATKAILVADDADHTNMVNYLVDYLGEEADAVVGVEAAVDAAGAYSFEDVEAGNYAIIFDRDGALPIFTYVTVTDANVVVPAKELINGDIDFDNNVGGGDISYITSAFDASYGDDAYNAIYDIDCDWNLGGGDISWLIANFDATMSDYSEAAIDDVFALFE